MMGQIHLWREETVGADGTTTVSAILEYPDQTRIPIWFRVPSPYNSHITSSYDPLVVAVLLLAMSQSMNIKVHGAVSPSLLRNLTEFQAAWSSWLPKLYHPIEINAEVEHEQYNPEAAEKAIAAFSGGVDSSFTVWRHRQNRCGRRQRNLQAGLVVHGFDIPLEKQSAFDSATKKARAILSSLDMELIPMSTNIRSSALNWEDIFGTAAAACLMLLQRGYSAGLIASSFPYQALSFPYGSNPITDGLLSSQSFQIVHDGAEFTRIEKIRELKNWTPAQQNLRVCWQGEEPDKNCGRCEKCVRTILIFRIFGVSLPPCFEHNVSDQQILNLQAKAGPLTELERVLDAAKAAKVSESWVGALEKSISHSQRLERREKAKIVLRNQIPATVLKSVRKMRSLFS
jgi:hypothetical protein